MRKNKIGTMLVFLISLVIVIGGWFLTKALLDQKRAEFLGKRGQISLQPSDSASFLAEGQESNVSGKGDGAAFLGEAVSEEMMAKVLAVWESGGREKLHEPKPGQMDMEQALEAGKSWINTMTEQGIIPEKLAEGSYDTIAARLCSVDTRVDFDERLLSYWSLYFAKDEITVTLVVHALSGQIWKASIFLWEEDGLTENYTEIEKWIPIAFPFMKEGKSEFVGEGSAGRVFSEGKVCAFVKVSEAHDMKGEWVKFLLHFEFELSLMENGDKIYCYITNN